jgi:hypothetical protein
MIGVQFPGRKEIFLFSIASRFDPRLSLPPTYLLLWTATSRANRLRREADHYLHPVSRIGMPANITPSHILVIWR